MCTHHSLKKNNKMNQENAKSFDSFREFASEAIEKIEMNFRSSFELYKKTAFPKDQLDALDYETICLIEDEFRKQEKICKEVLDKAINTFCEDSEKWLLKFKQILQLKTKTFCIMHDIFLIELKGYSFTYFAKDIPDHFFTKKIIQEAEAAHTRLFERKKIRWERVNLSMEKLTEKLLKNHKEKETAFHKAVANLIDEDIPSSIQKVRVIINQNFLQRAGSIHGMN